jgi:acyl transferase domain-containing protein/acyl carrier protein
MSESPDRRALLGQALAALDQMQARLDASERARTEPIAIVGLGCRFPGADGPEAMWRLLHDGVDAVTTVPPDRWDVEAYLDPDPEAPGKMYTAAGGFLGDVAGFDPRFFGISPREAVSVDPQQRLVLEVAWEALEHAALAPDRLVGSRTGVFVGIGSSDYAQLQIKAADPTRIDAYTGSGGGLCFAAGRLSYCLGLQGPSLVVDTACSSSLVAVHLAAQSLRLGECELALAGGVHLMLTPDVSIYLSRLKALAPDGKCKAFDAAADGFVRGEGCGVVVLKRLSDARRDGDRVLALMLGCAVNQDGPSGGLTVPNGPAQQALVRGALAAARREPGQVGFVEAHGTGTALGDPIELAALAAVFGGERSVADPLIVGTVKTNMGHLEAAAGIAGLIKTVLALGHGEIPPNLHFRTLNPHAVADGVPVLVPTRPIPWPSRPGPRLAGVSSFGLSGTNAHVILEQAPVVAPAPDGPERPLHVLTLSARSEPALRALADRVGAHLAAQPAESVADVAFTAGVGRARLPHRLAIVTASSAQAREQLSAFAGGTTVVGAHVGRRAGPGPKLAFLFTGQGAQHVGMGRRLYETHAGFRRVMDRCDEILRDALGRPLSSMLYPEPGAPPALDDTMFAQPALFALEYALAQVWRSWGIEPALVAGHSVGEYVAACVAGVFSLEDGLALVAERGRLMQALPRGAMAAVFADEDRVAAAVAPHGADVAIAAVNGPEHVVISGAPEPVRAILDELAQAGVRAQALSVSHAFHSPMMEPMLDAFECAVARVARAEPRIGLISNVTGELAGRVLTDTGYWRRHVRAPVQFAGVVRALARQGVGLFVEVGPSPTLVALGRRCLPDGAAVWLPSLRRGRDDWEQILDSLAAAYVHGLDVDWAGFDREYPRRRVALPTYPFQRERFWVPPASAAPVAVRAPAGPGAHPLLGRRLDVASAAGTHVWEGPLDRRQLGYLTDHRIQDAVVFPAAAYSEMVIAAARQILGDGSLVLSEVTYEAPLLLAADAEPTVQVTASVQPDGGALVHVYTRAADGAGRAISTRAWTRHATALVRRASGPAALVSEPDLAAARARCTEPVSGEEFYRALGERGNQWGPSFQGIVRLWRTDGEAVSEVRLVESLQDEVARYDFHPALSDACGQLLAATQPLGRGGASRGGAFVGGGIDEVRVHRPLRGQRFWSHARATPAPAAGRNVLKGDIRIIDERGRLAAELLGVRFWYLDPGDGTGAPPGIDDWLYEVRWTSRPSASPPAPPPGTGAWLVLADAGGVGDALVAHLRSRGRRGIRATAAAGFQRRGADDYTVRPGDPDDMRELVAAVADPASPVTGVVHLWSLDAADRDDLDVAALEAAQVGGCRSVLHLVQALSTGKPRTLPRLWLVTRHGQPAGAAARLAVAQAPLWGLGRTLAVEHAELWGGLVDLDRGSAPADAATQLAGEILGADGEDQIAFRGGERLVARLARVPRPARPAHPLRWHVDATYLVTGGLGGLGLEVARWMVREGARRIVLLGRAGLPPRASWSEIPAGARAAAQVEAVRDLERLGAHVHVAAVDVADERSLGAWLDTFRREGRPAIRGVVHAAGTLLHGPLAQTTAADLAAVLRPKVAGAWLLHRLLGDEPLDFFVMFSSASAVLSSPLVGGYAAANTFLDALAHHRAVEGRPALSVDWGVWSGAGMAQQADGEELAAIAARGMGSLTVEQGLEALGALLPSPAVQVGVIPVDWRLWRERYAMFAASPFLAEVVDGTATTGRPGRDAVLTRAALLALAAAARPQAVQDGLRAHAGAVLRLEPASIDAGESLTALGIDSLMAVELKNRVDRDLGLSIPLVHYLDGSSIGRLAELVLAGLAADDGAAADGVDEHALLARLPEMSEAEMDALLGRMLAPPEDS